METGFEDRVGHQIAAFRTLHVQAGRYVIAKSRQLLLAARQRAPRAPIDIGQRDDQESTEPNQRNQRMAREIVRAEGLIHVFLDNETQRGIRQPAPRADDPASAIIGIVLKQAGVKRIELKQTFDDLRQRLRADQFRIGPTVVFPFRHDPSPQLEETPSRLGTFRRRQAFLETNRREDPPLLIDDISFTGHAGPTITKEAIETQRWIFVQAEECQAPPFQIYWRTRQLIRIGRRILDHQGGKWMLR